MNETLVVALMASLGAFIVMLINAFTSAKKWQVDSLCQTIAALHEEDARLRTRVEDLERINTGLDQKIVSLEKMVSTLQDENDKLRIKVEDLARENTRLSSQLGVERRPKNLGC